MSCEKCAVSESFYSSLSADRFRRSHKGHDATKGPRPGELPPQAGAAGAVSLPPKPAARPHQPVLRAQGDLGEGRRDDAARLSDLLKAFRWKVEPDYAVGAMLDDILGIEARRNQVSRTLITAVERAGYLLTTVTLENGKLVAWFKRAGENQRPGAEPDLEAAVPTGPRPLPEHPNP